ncbi:MAG: penicillin-binding protein activator, partial [Marinobacter sp.]
SEHFSNTSGQLGRLFAMGADAWQIAKRLPLLRQIESASIDGLTGTLTMNDNGSIHRQQLWAQFRNGEAVLIEDDETSSETSDETTP